MANEVVFQNRSLVINEAGGLAYKMEPMHALVQYATTGCLNQTFYATVDTQVDTIITLCDKVDPERVAKIAVFARQNGYMKDVPALLCVWLSARGHNDLLSKVFSRVINNGKMLRNFVNILRSGVTGRKSLGSLPKRLIANWFNSRTTKEIFLQSVGNDPSFRDILRLAHPKPLDRTKNSLYRWLLGKDYEYDDLPDIVQQFEDFKIDNRSEVPNVPFEMLTSLKLQQIHWCQIAMRAGWQWLRMNLNTMQRHGVFDVAEMVHLVAKRLVDRDAINKAKVFPYQLLAAYKNSGSDIPSPIIAALQDALEIAMNNIPELPSDGCIVVDVSGSMKHAITGSRKGSTSNVRCVDVAGLLASAILRKNPYSSIIPFNTEVCKISINSRDTVLTNAEKLANMVGGGTDCASPIKFLNDKKTISNWVFMISDNQSWMDSLGFNKSNSANVKFSMEWDKFVKRNPGAKLVCLDIQPYSTVQVQDRKDVLNIGGFSDNVFEIVNLFFRNELAPSHLVEVIDSVEL